MNYCSNIINNFITRILKIVISFFCNVIVARSLGADGYGIASYLIMIATFIGGYTHLGLTNSTGYFIKKTNFNRDKIIINNMIVLLIINIFNCLILISLKLFSDNLNEYSWLMIIITIVMFISIMYQGLFTAVINSDENFKTINNVILNISILKLISLILLYFLKKLNVEIYIFIYMFEFLVTSLIFFRYINININRDNLKFDKYLIYDEIKYGLFIYLSGLLMFMNYRVDQFMIKGYLGDTSLGVYSLAVTLAELIFIIPSSIENVLFSRLINSENQYGILTFKTIKITLLISICMSICGIILSPIIRIIYGNDYINTIVPFNILLIGVVFASIAKVSISYYYSVGKTKVQLYIAIIVFIVNIVLNIIFIPLYGIIGAAMASTIAYIIYGCLYLILLKQSENIKLYNLVNYKEEIYILKNLLKRTVSHVE